MNPKHAAAKQPRRGIAGHTKFLVFVIATLAVTGIGAAAWAFFTSTGSGAGTATTASLAAPTNVHGTVSGTAVAVTWTGITSPGAGTFGYYVTRTPSPSGTAVNVCGSSPTALLPDSPTSCNDSSVPSGSYTYTVTAVFNSFSATSAGASVTVAAATPPTGVTFSGSPQVAKAIATWTVGFTTSSTGHLASGNTITATFPAGFTVPSGATVTLPSGFSNCTATETASGTVATVTLSGATCALANSTAGTLTIAGITNPIEGTYGANLFSVATSQDTTPANPAAAVNIAADTATVTAFTNSAATYGNETIATFTATAIGGNSVAIPNGDSIIISEGATTICTITPLASGSGTCSPTSNTVLPAAASAQTITATFNSTGADSNFVSTATKPSTITVSKDTGTVAITENHTTVTYGAESNDSITVTVTTGNHEVLPATESETVNVGSTTCAVTLTPGGNGGSGSCSIGNTAVAASVTAYQVNSTYSGDVDLSASLEATGTSLTVNKDSTITAVSESPTTVTYGNESATTFTVSVASGNGETVPTSETVAVKTGATPLCTITLSTPTCKIANTLLAAAGTVYPITATYGGDTNLVTSSGTASPGLTVNQDSTTASVTATATSASYGAESGVTFTAKVVTGNHEVLPATESGTIFVGSTSCPVSVAPSGTGGQGTCTIGATALSASGTAYSVTFTDGGDTDLSGSSQASVAGGFTVNKAVAPFSITVNGSSTSATITFGAQATLAEVGLPAGAAGTVTFTSGSTLCSFSYPTATSCKTSATLDAGSYSNFAATFTDSDGNFTGSTSTNSVSLTVNKAAAPFTITVNGSSTSATITFGAQATLAEAGLPAGATGTLTFTATSPSATLCTVSNYPTNTSCLTSATLAAASYTEIKAAFTDSDGNFTSSTSTNSVSLTVNTPPSINVTSVTRQNGASNHNVVSGTVVGGGSVSVTIYSSYNTTTCTAGTVQGTSSATVSSGTYTSGNITLIAGTTYFVQAVETGPSATSSVYTFLAPSGSGTATPSTTGC